MDTIETQCPWCYETIVLRIEPLADDQSYIEDCEVCCRPIDIHIWLDEDHHPHLTAAPAQ